MNTRKGKTNCKNLQILLDIVSSSMIVVGRLLEKLHPKKYDVVQWQTQAGDITNNVKVKWISP